VNIQGVVNGVKVCSDRKINVIRQVLNLHNTRETDFDSDEVTTWLEPVRIHSRGIHHGSISRCVPIDKNCYAAGFEPPQYKETDFDSDVVTTWLGAVKRRPEETIHESMPRYVPVKTTSFGRFLTYTVQGKQIVMLI
jgi:hypothetical protein